MIESAETQFPTSLRMAEHALHPSYGWTRPVPESHAIGVMVAVVVNDGRWIVQCPTCRSAQWAAKTDRRFMCVECGNADHGHQWVTVEWPDEIEAIESALEARPPGNRHWLPGQTVADLVAENTAHGVS
jgi:hypothetical protein